MPGLILATTRAGFVLLSAQDGSVTRVLAADGGGGSASRDTAYFTTGKFTPGCSESYSVASIGLDGQNRERIGPGRSPVVSPDGKQLAYVRGIGRQECSLENVVVRDLRTGKEHTWKVGHPLDVTNFSWASDSRHLLVTSYPDNDSAGPDIEQVVDTDTSGRLADAPKLPVSLAAGGGGYTLGELGDTGTVATFSESDGRIVARNPKTGDEVRTLYTFPGPFDDPDNNAHNPSYLPRFIFEDHYRFASDASGKHLLWVVRTPGKDDSLVYRFSVGDPAPVKLGDGVSSASWVPGSER
jgi:hypothetical protein